MKPTPSEKTIGAAIRDLDAAVTAAQEIRARHRGKKRPTRRSDLDATILELRRLADPLRSYIGMVSAHDIDFEIEAAMKRVVAAAHAERQKLSKMRWPSTG